MAECEKSAQPTLKWLVEQIEDESKSQEMYCEYGFPEIARDEARHEKMLTEFLHKMEGG